MEGSPAGTRSQVHSDTLLRLTRFLHNLNALTCSQRRTLLLCLWPICLVDLYKYDSTLLESAIDHPTTYNNFDDYQLQQEHLLDTCYFNRNNSNAVPAKIPEK